MSEQVICTCDADAMMKWDEGRECFACCGCGCMVDETRWNDDEDYDLEDWTDYLDYGFQW